MGDTIRITFKNGVPYNATLHPHGVFYPKDAEGAIYNDGTSGARCTPACHPAAIYLRLNSYLRRT